MRLFFGLSLPAAVHHAVCNRAEACRKAIEGRYVLEENYHMTLAFLGDVPENRVQEAEQVLQRCVSRTPAPRALLSPPGLRSPLFLAVRICISAPEMHRTF